MVHLEREMTTSSQEPLDVQLPVYGFDVDKVSTVMLVSFFSTQIWNHKFVVSLMRIVLGLKQLLQRITPYCVLPIKYLQYCTFIIYPCSCNCFGPKLGKCIVNNVFWSIWIPHLSTHLNYLPTETTRMLSCGPTCKSPTPFGNSRQAGESHDDTVDGRNPAITSWGW